MLLLLAPVITYSRLPAFATGITLIKLIGAFAVLGIPMQLASVRYPLMLYAWAETRLFTLLVAWVGLSGAMHGYGPVSVISFATYISFFIYFLVTVVYVDSLPRLRTSCMVLLFSTFLASLSVYNEYFRWHVPRPGGVVGDPNYYAMMAVTVLPFALNLFPLATRAEKLFLAVTVASLLFSIMLSGSRGGLIGLGICLLFALKHAERKLAIIAVLLFSGLLVAVLPDSPVQRFLHPGYDAIVSSQRRALALDAGFSMIRDHPLIGVGAGRFKSDSTIYTPDLAGGNIAHNTYINVAAELGVPMCLVFMSILGLAWNRARKLARHCAAHGYVLETKIAQSIATAIVVFASTAVFLTADTIKHIWIVIFFGAALSRLVRIREGIAAAGPLPLPATPPNGGRQAAVAFGHANRKRSPYRDDFR